MLAMTTSRRSEVGRALLVALLCGPLTAGCVTHTRFQTRPEGATLYLNGEEMGTTPIRVTSRRGLPKRYRVQLAKEGYEPVEVYLDNEMSVWWAICLGPAVAPLFWAWRLADGYEYRLKAVEKNAAKSPPALPAKAPAPPPPASVAPPVAVPTIAPATESIPVLPPPSATPASPPAPPPAPPPSSSPLPPPPPPTP